MSVDTAYLVRLTSYEGPIELLATSIRRNRVDIYDVPIAEITGAYLEALEPDGELDGMMEFCYPIAGLLLMKSRMLLPHSEIEDETNYSDIIGHVIEYQRLKYLTNLLEQRSRHSEVWPERRDYEVALPPDGHGELSAHIDAMVLHNALGRVMSTLTPHQLIDVSEDITVAEKRVLLDGLLDSREQCDFGELIVRSGSILEIVCALLAALDAARAGRISILQERLFGDIVLQKKPLSTDRAED